MRIARALFSLFLISSLTILAACKKEPPPAPPAERVENSQLGIAIAALPADFAVTSNDGATIELAPTGEGASGSVTVLAGEPQTSGINLYDVIQQHKTQILERTDGDYKGQTEFVSPMGTTFVSRGRWTGDSGPMEESVVFMLHPLGDRTLQVIYAYPAADDTQARVNALMEGVVGELEGLTAEAEAPAE